MEKEPKEKKEIRISLSSAILITILLLGLLAGVLLLGINALKPEVENEVKDNNRNIPVNQNIVANEKINNIEKIPANNKETVATDEEKIEDIIEKFLNIEGMNASLTGPLNQIGYNVSIDELEKRYYQNEIEAKEINGIIYYDTGLKYEEVKEKMLGYMTEELYKKSFFYETCVNIAGNLYCSHESTCEFKDTRAEHISHEGNIDKFLITTTYFEDGFGVNPYQCEIEVKDGVISKCGELRVVKDPFGITSIEEYSDKFYIITGYALEDEIRKVSLEEFNKVKNGETIEFRKEKWKKERITGEEIWLISDSGKNMALRLEEDYYVFSSLAGADKPCADYSDSVIKFSIAKDATIKIQTDDGTTTMNEFVTTNWKGKSGAYAEYTPIIENNSIIGFSCLLD